MTARECLQWLESKASGTSQVGRHLTEFARIVTGQRGVDADHRLWSSR